MVEPSFDLAITRVRPRQFQRQIEQSLQHGFKFCTLQDYLQAPTLNSIALTFDDGYASIYQNAFPILHSYGIPATVFVIAGYVGQYDQWDINFGGFRFAHARWQELERLCQAGWEIESHALSHLDLSKLDKPGCMKELELSKALIERRLGTSVRYISFPFGNTDQRVIDCCMQAGYEGGVVMSGQGKAGTNRFLWPRLGVYYFDTERTFLHKILAKYEKTYKFMQRVIDVCSNGTVLVKHSMLATKR